MLLLDVAIPGIPATDMGLAAGALALAVTVGGGALKILERWMGERRPPEWAARIVEMTGDFRHSVQDLVEAVDRLDKHEEGRHDRTREATAKVADELTKVRIQLASIGGKNDES